MIDPFSNCLTYCISRTIRRLGHGYIINNSLVDNDVIFINLMMIIFINSIMIIFINLKTYSSMRNISTLSRVIICVIC